MKVSHEVGFQKSSITVKALDINSSMTSLSINSMYIFGKDENTQQSTGGSHSHCSDLLVLILNTTNANVRYDVTTDLFPVCRSVVLLTI